MDIPRFSFGVVKRHTKSEAGGGGPGGLVLMSSSGGRRPSGCVSELRAQCQTNLYDSWVTRVTIRKASAGSQSELLHCCCCCCCCCYAVGPVLASRWLPARPIFAFAPACSASGRAHENATVQRTVPRRRACVQGGENRAVRVTLYKIFVLRARPQTYSASCWQITHP